MRMFFQNNSFRINCRIVSCKISGTLFAETIFAFLGAHNSRKIKNKIGCRFFASFECASVNGSGPVGCSGLCESVQFSARRNQTYRETLPCNSYAFTG